VRTLQSSRYPTILAAAIALPLLSGLASGETVEEAHRVEVAKQARTCENMLVIGHPALDDIDVLSRCSQAASLQEDVLEGKPLPDPLPDIDVRSAVEKWRAKAAAAHDHEPAAAKNVAPEVRAEPRPATGYRDPVSRPVCDGVMTDNGCQPRQKRAR
jgi:hypothetical protein